MPAPDDRLSPALQSLTARFGEMLRRIGTQHGLRAADIDELVQEVRIRLWRARPASELLATVSASYMYRTAITAALTVIRRRRAKTHGQNEPLEALDRGAGSSNSSLTAASADERLDQSVLESEIEMALATLPASRAPVVRMHLAGYNREEIAGLLGWSDAKVRNLLYRGLGDLRAALAARGIGPNDAKEAATHE